MIYRVQKDVLSSKAVNWYFRKCAPPSHSPKVCRSCQGERMSFCTLCKGSLTIETALILPLFLWILLSFFSMYGIWEQHAQLLTAAVAEAEQTAVIGSSITSPQEKVRIYKTDLVKSLVKPLGMDLEIKEQAMCRKWIGFTEGFGDEEKFLVYITPKGIVYHLSAQCSYLDLQIRKVSLETAVCSYRPCKRCENPIGVYVYVTEEGDCYHGSHQCGGLKREIRCVPISQAAGKGCCSRCKRLKGEAG